MDLVNLADKVVIVTGGAGGIGRAIVTDCASVGAKVVIADLNEAAAQVTAQEVSQATGQTVIAVQTDVTDLDSVQALKDHTLKEFGRIDVLVNNAGWDKFIPFLKTTPDFWDKIINLNYRGALNCCYVIMPELVAQKSGAIVNIASDAGRAGSMGEAVYAGCKAGVIAFSKTLAREHARDNVRVNIVAPGITRTGLHEEIVSTDFGEKVWVAIEKAVPLGRRAGEPNEISPAVIFLASDAARFITGQVLSVNGGLTMQD